MKNKLPDGWKEMKLEDVVEFIMGQAPPSNSYNEEGNGTLFIRAGDFGRLYPKTSSYTTSPLVLGKEGDVFLCVVGATSGKINLGINGAITRSIFALRPKPNILQKFLYYYLKGEYENLNKSKSGSAQGILNKAGLKNMLIPIPPLQVQKHIISILEKAEKLKEKRENAGKLTEEYLQSLFYEMFGDPANNPKKWPIKKLEVLSKVIQSGFAYGQFNEMEGIVHIRPFNISEDGFLILNQIKYVPRIDVKPDKYRLSYGDILINTTNSVELVGKTAIFSLHERYCFSNHMTKITLEYSLANPYYIWFVLNRYWKSGIFKSLIKSWVNQVGIDSGLLKKIEIPLPPIRLQQKFASVVEDIEKLKEKQKQSKEEINIIFSSLMKQAFNGELIA